MLGFIHKMQSVKLNSVLKVTNILYNVSSKTLKDNTIILLAHKDT